MESNKNKRRSSRERQRPRSERGNREEDFFGLGGYTLDGESRQAEDKFGYSDNPFFAGAERHKRAVNGENKDYKPWEEDDSLSRRAGRVRMDNSPRVRRKEKDTARVGSLKRSIGKVSKGVFSTGEDEDAGDTQADGIANTLKSTRNNKKLLDELNSKKKPPTKRQRKLKNVLLSGGIVLVVLVIGAVLSLTVLFKCENIEVNGSTRYKQEDIIAAGRLSYGENIFMLDKATAAKNIEAKYPYIEKADITFGIPNSIIINVTEAVPEYYIQSGTRFYIISKENKILEETVERELDIPTIVGCKLKDVKVGQTAKVENDKALTVLAEIANTMEANSVTGIKEIDLTDMSDIKLNYQDRITIVLGMPEYIDYKMRTAMTIIFTKLSESDKGRLDCSNLVEDRTDGKSNKSYFAPNKVISENPTEAPTASGTNVTEPVTEPLEPNTAAVPSDTYSDTQDDTYSDGQDDTYSDTQDDAYSDSQDDMYSDGQDDTYSDIQDDTYSDGQDDIG